MTRKTGAKSNRLKNALAAFRLAAGDHLDPKAAAVLDRLAVDESAAAAFAELDLNEAGAAKILTACIEAEELRRTFKDHIDLHTKSEGGRGGRLDRLSKAVAELRRFVNELDRPPNDRLSASLWYDPSMIEEMKRGLYYIDDAIKARRTIAKETIRRLGATRKSVDSGKAAETAAWLAEGVRRCCGRHRKAAADLAEVILGCKVSIERFARPTEPVSVIGGSAKVVRSDTRKPANEPQRKAACGVDSLASIHDVERLIMKDRLMTAVGRPAHGSSRKSTSPPSRSSGIAGGQRHRRGVVRRGGCLPINSETRRRILEPIFIFRMERRGGGAKGSIDVE
jgi:hypothetical protein